MAALLRGLRAGRALRGLGSGKTVLCDSCCWRHVGSGQYVQPIRLYLQSFRAYSGGKLGRIVASFIRANVTCHRR